uniref:Uncharacterized protein n=1 Tax=Anguilla anguilla TaxID=7936 RepID=A0A0E9W4X8_ANGAN
MCDLVHVDAAVISFLLIVTIPTSVKQDAILFVLFGIQHVVAFLTETNTYESWLVISPLQIHCNYKNIARCYQFCG